MDAQLGLFISTDNGKTFRPYRFNPVFVNDLSDTLQDDHIVITSYSIHYTKLYDYFLCTDFLF